MVLERLDDAVRVVLVVVDARALQAHLPGLAHHLAGGVQQLGQVGEPLGKGLGLLGHLVGEGALVGQVADVGPEVVDLVLEVGVRGGEGVEGGAGAGYSAVEIEVAQEGGGGEESGQGVGEVGLKRGWG